MPKSKLPQSRPDGQRRPRYPDLRIAVQSDNPLVMVAAVREELRLVGAPPDEIRDFSDQALSTGVDREIIRQVVEEWVGVTGTAGQSEFAARP